MKIAAVFLICFVAFSYANIATRDNLVRLLQSEMDTMSLVEKRDTIVGVLASFIPSVIDLLTQAIIVTIESFVPEAGQNAIVKTILGQVNLALKNVTAEALAPVLAAQITAA